MGIFFNNKTRDFYLPALNMKLQFKIENTWISFRVTKSCSGQIKVDFGMTKTVFLNMCTTFQKNCKVFYSIWENVEHENTINRFIWFSSFPTKFVKEWRMTLMTTMKLNVIIQNSRFTQMSFKMWVLDAWKHFDSFRLDFPKCFARKEQI